MEKQNNEIFLKLFSMVLVIFSTDAFITFANINSLPKNIFQVFGVLYIISVLIINHGVFSKSKIIIYCAFFAMGILTIVVNNDTSNGNFVKLFVLLLGLMISEVLSFKDFKILYIKSMSLISAVSLVGYFLTPIISRLPFIPIINNGQKTVACLLLTNIDISTNRNWGPFWEPGVFSIYLCLSLIFLLSEDEFNIKSIVLNTLALITTFSTTGYICFIFVLIGFYLKKMKKITARDIVIIIVGIGISILLFNSENFFDLIFGKFSINSSSYASSSSRIGSLIANLLCIKTNWWCGVGVRNLSQIVENYRLSRGFYFFSNTNGLLMNYGIFGCFFGALYTIMLIRFVKRLSRKSVLTFIFWSLSLILSLFAEPLVNSLLFNLIIFYGITSRRDSYEKYSGN